MAVLIISLSNPAITHFGSQDLYLKTNFDRLVCYLQSLPTPLKTDETTQRPVFVNHIYHHIFL